MAEDEPKERPKDRQMTEGQKKTKQYSSHFMWGL